MKTESTVTHTRGPWMQTPFWGDAATGLPGNCIYGPDNKRVAEILHTNSRHADEHEANAALIAAAPDLLNACKLAGDTLAWLDRMAAERKFSEDMRTTEFRAALETVRAAIDKAEGRTA